MAFVFRWPREFTMKPHPNRSWIGLGGQGHAKTNNGEGFPLQSVPQQKPEGWTGQPFAITLLRHWLLGWGMDIHVYSYISILLLLGGEGGRGSTVWGMFRWPKSAARRVKNLWRISASTRHPGTCYFASWGGGYRWRHGRRQESVGYV